MKGSDEIKISCDVLVWARETLAISRNAAAERLGMSLNRLAVLEDGKRNPTLEELKLFSKEYKRTIATLLLSTPPKEKPLPKDRRTIDSKIVGRFHEKSIIAVRKARALSKSLIELKTDAGISIPKFNYNASISDSPKALAQKLRKDLNLDEIREIESINHILESYVQKIEMQGIAVFQLSLTQDNLRGFSVVDEEIPIIVIKRGGEQATSKIFTLFHELGHIILDEGGLCDISLSSEIKIEKWCNEFAAEILIPSEDLLKESIVQQHQASRNMFWQKQELVALGQVFHVGPLAMLRSLKEHNLTTLQFYQEKHEDWNKPSFGRSSNPEGRNIAKETITEKGRTYIWLAFKAYDQNRINLKDLSDFLGVRLSYIPKTRELLNTA